MFSAVPSDSNELAWRRLEKQSQTGEIIRARVTHDNPAGIWLDIMGIKGLLPYAYCQTKSYKTDQEIFVRVVTVNRAKNQLLVTDKEQFSSCRLGKDIDTGEIVTIGDIERRSGLYVVGRPGMGKTSLLVNLILQDIEHGHGVFFLDPKGDAIHDLMKRIPETRKGDIILLDPKDPTHSFGINLLACKNITDRNEREETYTRAVNVFKKLWEDWGVFLEWIVPKMLYAMIESQDCTLAEAPMFLSLANSYMREQVVKQMRYKLDIRDFWLNEFTMQRIRDQQDQLRPTLARIEALLSSDYVRHVVGQQKTTIDFERIMEERKIVLVKLPSEPESTKRFLGTILVSELWLAAKKRPVDKRPQFCIFVDEFQNFATEDFARLINEGRGYGLATTIAHQERFGQFADAPEIVGATGGAANKIFFQLATKDAPELAPEVAKSPPQPETKPLTLVRNVVDYLLTKSHGENNYINDFVTNYLQKLNAYSHDVVREENVTYRNQIKRHKAYPTVQFDAGSNDDIRAYREYPYDPNTIRDMMEGSLNTFLFETMSQKSVRVSMPDEILQGCSRIFGFYNFNRFGKISEIEATIKLFEEETQTKKWLKSTKDRIFDPDYSYIIQNPHLLYDIYSEKGNFWIAYRYIYEYYDERRWKEEDVDAYIEWLEGVYRAEKKACVDFLVALRKVQVELIKNPIYASLLQPEPPQLQRTYKDMVDEMTHELLSLPRFTAYAKIVKEEHGVQTIGKHKITTFRLSQAHESYEKEIRERTQEMYCLTRTEIEKEITERREKWRLQVKQEVQEHVKDRLKTGSIEHEQPQTQTPEKRDTHPLRSRSQEFKQT